MKNKLMSYEDINMYLGDSNSPLWLGCCTNGEPYYSLLNFPKSVMNDYRSLNSFQKSSKNMERLSGFLGYLKKFSDKNNLSLNYYEGEFEIDLRVFQKGVKSLSDLEIFLGKCGELTSKILSSGINKEILEKTGLSENSLKQHQQRNGLKLERTLYDTLSKYFSNYVNFFGDFDEYKRIISPRTNLEMEKWPIPKNSTLYGVERGWDWKESRFNPEIKEYGYQSCARTMFSTGQKISKEDYWNKYAEVLDNLGKFHKKNENKLSLKGNDVFLASAFLAKEIGAELFWEDVPLFVKHYEHDRGNRKNKEIHCHLPQNCLLIGSSLS